MISEQLQPKDQPKALDATAKIGKIIADAYGKTHTAATHVGEEEKISQKAVIAPSSPEMVAAAETK